MDFTSTTNFTASFNKHNYTASSARPAAVCIQAELSAKYVHPGMLHSTGQQPPPELNREWEDDDDNGEDTVAAGNTAHSFQQSFHFP